MYFKTKIGFVEYGFMPNPNHCLIAYYEILEQYRNKGLSYSLLNNFFQFLKENHNNEFTEIRALPISDISEKILSRLNFKWLSDRYMVKGCD